MTDTAQAGPNEGPQYTSSVVINGSQLGSSLQQMLMAPDIQPGSSASYQLCKIIYTFHPLGAKMVDTPIKLAMSQPRKIVVPNSPEDDIIAQFNRQWEADQCDEHVFNTARIARIYGISAAAILIDGLDSLEPIDYKKLWKQTISYNVLDPLNTSGSLVLNQDPNAPDFQKTRGIAIAGVSYHRSRSVVIMNEDPLYIEYNPSSFGFNGRSVYQRALYPLKIYVQTMVTDYLVTYKAGVLVTVLKQIGSAINNMMRAVAGLKRSMVQMAQTGNVLTVQEGEDVKSIDMTNLEAPATMARKNTIDNIATAADMPAVMLQNETLAQGFADGSEDAKVVAAYVETVQKWMKPLFVYFDRATMHRAWNPDFYKTIQEKFPTEYGSVPYETAFQRWSNDFAWAWPSLLREPESQQIEVEDVKLRGLIAKVEVLLPVLDPKNKAALVRNCIDIFNEMKLLFPEPQEFDEDAFIDFLMEQKASQDEQAKAALSEPKPPRPFADSRTSHDLARAVDRVKERERAREAA